MPLWCLPSPQLPENCFTSTQHPGVSTNHTCISQMLSPRNLVLELSADGLTPEQMSRQGPLQIPDVSSALAFPWAGLGFYSPLGSRPVGSVPIIHNQKATDDEAFQREALVVFILF